MESLFKFMHISKIQRRHFTRETECFHRFVTFHFSIENNKIRNGILYVDDVYVNDVRRPPNQIIFIETHFTVNSSYKPRTQTHTRLHSIRHRYHPLPPPTHNIII